MAYTKINDYRFDLAAEVANAFTMFPQLKDTVFFVEARKDAKGKKDNDAPLVCHGPAWDKHKDDPARADYVRSVREMTFKTGQSRAARNVKFSGLWFIVINLFDGRPALKLCFAFDHELGHQLVPYGSFGATREGYLSGESAADSFAALRCLQRFGQEQGLRLLTDRAAERVLALVKGASHYTADWEHLTTEALAHIVKEEPVKKFENLGPAETIETADYIARNYSPNDQQAQETWRKARDIMDFSADAGTEEHHWEDVAKKGGSTAKLGVALRFLNGDGVKKDEARAFHWFAQAAQRENAEAQAWLGYCYRSGTGVARNLPEAFRFYRLSADQRHKPGLRGLADCYAQGLGTPRDDKAAAELYRRAGPPPRAAAPAEVKVEATAPVAHPVAAPAPAPVEVTIPKDLLDAVVKYQGDGKKKNKKETA